MSGSIKNDSDALVTEVGAKLVQVGRHTHSYLRTLEFGFFIPFSAIVRLSHD